MRKIALLLAIIVVLSTAISFGTNQATAQSTNELKLYVTGDNVTVENSYYRITFNLSMGAQVYSWQVKEGSNLVNLVESSPIAPTLSLDFYTVKSPKSTGISYGNKTVNITSSSLMLGKWKADVMENRSKLLVLKFYPVSQDALGQIEPLNLNMLVYFYADQPYIDVYYLIENPTHTPVYPEKIVGDATFFLSFFVYNHNETMSQWNGTLLYNSLKEDKLVFKHDIRSEYLLTVRDGNLQALGAFSNSTKEISLISPIAINPEYILVSTTVHKASPNIKGIEYKVGYAIEKIDPLSSEHIGLRVTYGLSYPCTLQALHIIELYNVTNPSAVGAFNVYKDTFPSKIVQLNNTIKGLKEAKDNLLKKIDELNYQIQYWKGNSTYWKANYAVAKESIASCRADVDRASTISVVGALLGIIIGFIGGAVFYKKRY
ncbi:MAG: hypothetical protein F7B60_04620 [Desulfurococcales archaeon]|nr:hypothetical protein [Desulfurococcales archaeon]